MAERSDAPEGWGVRQRLPILAALGTVTTLVMLLAIAGYFYDHKLRPATITSYATFPAPGVEPTMHPGVNDPELPVARPGLDPRIVAAKRDVVASGLPGWEPQT